MFEGGRGVSSVNSYSIACDIEERQSLGHFTRQATIELHDRGPLLPEVAPVSREVVRAANRRRSTVRIEDRIEIEQHGVPRRWKHGHNDDSLHFAGFLRPKLILDATGSKVVSSCDQMIRRALNPFRFRRISVVSTFPALREDVLHFGDDSRPRQRVVACEFPLRRLPPFGRFE